MKSDLSTELYSTERPYTFSFEDTSLNSVLLNPSNILPKQSRVERLTLLVSALNLKIYNVNSNRYCVCFSKINSRRISGDPKLPIISSAGPSPHN